MRIERLNKCCGSRGNLSAVDFQPHSQPTNSQRIATSGGTYVQIWSLSNPEDKGSSDPVKCVLLFTFKDHSPYDVTTIRWSPDGQYLASTDSGGITNVLRRNEKKSKVMESMVKSKLSGEPPEIPEAYTETTQVKKYTIKYDGTDQNKKNNSGVQRISLTSKNVQVESKEVKADNLNLLNHDNLEGNLESWETLASLSCPNNMGQLFDISWAPDNRSIIGGGMNGHVIVFDIYTKEIVAKFDALENSQDSSSGRGYIKSVSWDPMTLFVAVQSSNKEISIWRRSPPLPPGSPMKWTFKRVMYTDHFSEKSNTDVLGGSRLSWAPNGKNVVFPNSCFNNHNFSTCYQIQHNTSSFAHLFTKSNYDKNQAQYHFDTMEHPIDLEPVLLKGHNSRIRNVRFSNDIMKNTQSDSSPPNHEKFLLLAQSSDDNMLSVWRFKVNQECIVSVECICVLKNLLDEQSSIEDLAWGDFGRCLAVASSQGGLILIQFNYDEMGTKFYTNRIQGLNLNEMNQPPYEFFDYSEYVNSLAEDPNDSSKQNSDLNHTGGVKYKTAPKLSQNSCFNYIDFLESKLQLKSILQSGSKPKSNLQPYSQQNLSLKLIENVIVSYFYNSYFCKNMNNTVNNSYIKDSYWNSNGLYYFDYQDQEHNLNQIRNRNRNINNNIEEIYQMEDLKVAFLIFCYRIYLISLFWKMKCECNNSMRSEKRPLSVGNVYNITFYKSFYLFNFTVESDSKDSKLSQAKKRQKVTKKVKTVPVLVDFITDIWLDMDYGSGNTVVTRYWNETEYQLENGMREARESKESKENEVVDKVVENNSLLNMNVSSQNVIIDATPSKVDKPAKVPKVSKSEKAKLNKSGSSSKMFDLCNVDGLNDFNENLFDQPVLKQSVSVSSRGRKFLGVNFLNSSSFSTTNNYYFNTNSNSGYDNNTNNSSKGNYSTSGYHDNSNNCKTFTSSLTSIEEGEFKVFWVRYLKKGYVTHIDTWSEYVVALSQKLEVGDSRSYLTVLNTRDGYVYLDELELGYNTVSMFNLLLWNNPYFVVVTTNAQVGLYKYEYPTTLIHLLKLDLSHVPRDSILKLEVINSTLNYRSIFDQKLRSSEEQLDVFESETNEESVLDKRKRQRFKENQLNTPKDKKYKDNKKQHEHEYREDEEENEENRCNEDCEYNDRNENENKSENEYKGDEDNEDDGYESANEYDSRNVDVDEDEHGYRYRTCSHNRSRSRRSGYSNYNNYYTSNSNNSNYYNYEDGEQEYNNYRGNNTNSSYKKSKSKNNDNYDENLVLVLYKKNKSVSLYSREYNELELSLDSLCYSNNSLHFEKNDSFNLDSLFRFYSNDPESFMFGQVEFDGSLSKVIQSFTDAFDQNNLSIQRVQETQGSQASQGVKESQGLQGTNGSAGTQGLQVLQCSQGSQGLQASFVSQRSLVNEDSFVDRMKLYNSLKLKLKAFLLLGSVWEYLLHLYEYVKMLFQLPKLEEVLEFTSGMYKNIIRMMKENESKLSQVKFEEIKVYDIGNYYKLVPHCLLVLRSVVLPTLNSLYRRFQVDVNMSLEHFDEYDCIEKKSRCMDGFDNKYLRKFSPSLEYQENEKKELLEVNILL